MEVYMTKLKFNDYYFDIDARYTHVPFGTFVFYAKTNSSLNMLKANHGKVHECEFIYPSGKVEKKKVAFKDFRMVETNRYGYISQILAVLL